VQEINWKICLKQELDVVFCLLLRIGVGKLLKEVFFSRGEFSCFTSSFRFSTLDFYGNTIDLAEGSAELTGIAPPRKIIEMEQKQLSGKLNKEEQRLLDRTDADIRQQQSEEFESDLAHNAKYSKKIGTEKENSKGRKRKVGSADLNWSSDVSFPFSYNFALLLLFLFFFL
jgi:hypothetical protein